MFIFALILLILSAIGSLVSIAQGEAPLGGIALCVFFTLYLMGVGQ